MASPRCLHSRMYSPRSNAVRAAGVRIITVTNGSAENTTKLLSRAGLSDFVEKTVSIDEVRHCKPHRDTQRERWKLILRDSLSLPHMTEHTRSEAGRTAHRRCTASNSALPFGDVATDVKGGTLVEVVDGLLALPAS